MVADYHTPQQTWLWGLGEISRGGELGQGQKDAKVKCQSERQVKGEMIEKAEIWKMWGKGQNKRLKILYKQVAHSCSFPHTQG
jgi:hypothetical protein